MLLQRVANQSKRVGFDTTKDTISRGVQFLQHKHESLAIQVDTTIITNIKRKNQNN